MIDSAGREIKTGDVVEIKGAYFANENGLWFVEHAPEDPCWCGSDCSLHKLRKDGKPSATNQIAFWPLTISSNSYEKQVLGNAWNEAHATISVIDGMDRKWIREHFKKEADEMSEIIEWSKWNFGPDSKDYKLRVQKQEFLRSVAASIA